MVVSKNRAGPPKSSILIGFPLFLPSILGFFPLFLETPKSMLMNVDDKFFGPIP